MSWDANAPIYNKLATIDNYTLKYVLHGINQLAIRSYSYLQLFCAREKDVKC